MTPMVGAGCEQRSAVDPGVDLAHLMGKEVRQLWIGRLPMVETTAGPERGTEDRTSESETQREEHTGIRGDRILAKLKELIHEGNVRHVVIKNDEGRTLIEFPVSVGVAGAVLVPVWAAVGALAALVTNCSIEVERDKEGS